MSFQQIIIQGNTGKEPEVRYAASGKAVTNFSVAVSEKRSGKEETEWFNCVAFDKTAEVVGQYVKKGSPILVTGRIKTEQYEKDGVTRYSTKVMVDRVVLLGSKQGGTETTKSGANEKPSASDFDDIPFDQPFRQTWRVV